MSDSTELARSTPDVATLIQFAIEKQCSSETMQGLYDLAKRAKEDAAEEAFNVAFTRFQNICPPIIKDKRAPNNRFASLENIKRVIQPFLAECNLSYSFTATFVDNCVKAVCTVRHISGHAKQSEFVAPISDVIKSKTGNVVTNGMQMTAMSHTYAKRYALVDALGLTIADEDTDGNHPPELKDDAKTTPVRDNRASEDSLKAAYAKWQKMNPSLSDEECWFAWLKFARASGGPDDAKHSSSWSVNHVANVNREMDVIGGAQ